MDFQMNDRTCLITGASVGIGVGVAKVLAHEKARIAITARRADLLDQVADEIERECGLRPLVIVEDLTASGGPDRVAQQVLEAFGKLDVLVNNAGASRPVDLAQDRSGAQDIDDVWAESFALNFDAVRRLSEAVLPSMQAKRYGRIVNLTGYIEPRHLNAAYSAKAAVNAWSKGISCVVAKDGVTINCIAPGLIKSEQILQRILPDRSVRDAVIKESVPIGYMGEPEDIGNLVAFLSSPAARYITGALIPVDGGMHHFSG